MMEDAGSETSAKKQDAVLSWFEPSSPAVVGASKFTVTREPIRKLMRAQCVLAYNLRFRTPSLMPLFAVTTLTPKQLFVASLASPLEKLPQVAIHEWGVLDKSRWSKKCVDGELRITFRRQPEKPGSIEVIFSHRSDVSATYSFEVKSPEDADALRFVILLDIKQFDSNRVWLLSNYNLLQRMLVEAAIEIELMLESIPSQESLQEPPVESRVCPSTPPVSPPQQVPVKPEERDAKPMSEESTPHPSTAPTLQRLSPNSSLRRMMAKWAKRRSASIAESRGSSTAERSDWLTRIRRTLLCFVTPVLLLAGVVRAFQSGVVRAFSTLSPFRKSGRVERMPDGGGLSAPLGSKLKS